MFLHVWCSLVLFLAMGVWATLLQESSTYDHVSVHISHNDLPSCKTFYLEIWMAFVLGLLLCSVAFACFYIFLSLSVDFTHA